MSAPALFAARTFAEAMEDARREGRWLIVDATAQWCAPCKLMDRTTWQDADVIAWVKEHAIAIQVDVDEETEVAGSLGIQAMPTVIVFRDGKEQDRVVGLKKPAEMLAWLAGVARGERDIDRVRRSVDAEHDMKGRLGLARGLLHAGKLDEALEHYLWLWRNIHRVEPAMTGVRVSFMASEMETLCRQSPEARARFAAVRDETEAAAEAGGGNGTSGSGGPAAEEARFDWVVLNDVLGETDRTLAWFDGVKDDPAQAAPLRHLSHRLIPALRGRERWADIGRLLQDPAGQLRRDHDVARMTVKKVPAEMRDQILEALGQHVRDQAALFHRALLAAGRTEDAAELAAEALRIDDSDAMKAALGRG
jgi:thioredoxin-like negative regulator of GroEL